MKTKSPHPKRAQAKRAKARVMILLHAKSGAYSDYTLHPDATDAHFAKIADESSERTVILSHVLVAPMSAKQARAAARFWNLGEEERVEAIAGALWAAYQDSVSYGTISWAEVSRGIAQPYRDRASAILNLIAPTK